VDRIYRVNDDLRLLGAPQGLIKAEQDLAHHFTRISTASPILAQRFAHHSHVTLDPMGIPRALTDAPQPNPYTPRSDHKIAVCAGTTQLDMTALDRIAKSRPNWDIHVLGRLKSEPVQRHNITWHGEQSFQTTLAHVAHADIGLAPYNAHPGIEYQTTNSNRMLLYRHFGLPILGPDQLCTLHTPMTFGYSMQNALARCETTPKKPEHIADWSQLAERLTQNGVTLPPKDVSTEPETAEKPRVKTVPALTSSA
jgi:2-beta-glucuronyltransferase